MFNSTLTGNARVWFDDLLAKSIDSYDDLKKAFLENYLEQKKCIKDPIEIHNIKQRDGSPRGKWPPRIKREKVILLMETDGRKQAIVKLQEWEFSKSTEAGKKARLIFAPNKNT
ncbi:reverse transcriptase domain-containing protein [Tanacetum coccineum]